MELVTDKSQLDFFILENNISTFLPINVLEDMQLYLFKRGEFICREGLPLHHLFFLVKGKCKVSKVLENGKESLICFYNNFQLLGEFELIHEKISKTNIQALEDTYCLVISILKYKDVLLGDTSFMKFLCSQLCNKLERSDKNSSINLHYPLEQRLASYILYMQKEYSFFDNYTHLAEYLGCSHRHLLRILHELCNKGILEKDNHLYKIKSLSALKKIAGDSYQ